MANICAVSACDIYFHLVTVYSLIWKIKSRLNSSQIDYAWVFWNESSELKMYKVIWILCVIYTWHFSVALPWKIILNVIRPTSYSVEVEKNIHEWERIKSEQTSKHCNVKTYFYCKRNARRLWEAFISLLQVWHSRNYLHNLGDFSQKSIFFFLFVVQQNPRLTWCSQNKEQPATLQRKMESQTESEWKRTSEKKIM